MRSFLSRTTAVDTVLVLDIESASVGCALVALKKDSGPRLFAEHRTALPIFTTLTSSALLSHTVTLAAQELRHISETAVRMEQHGQKLHISRVVVFCAPPWSHTSQKKGRIEWHFDGQLLVHLKTLLLETFMSLPVSFYATGEATAHTAHRFLNTNEDLLLFSVFGEVSEMLHLEGNTVLGRATIPVGSHTALRTIASHSGLPLSHSPSLLRIAHTKAPSARTFAPALMSAGIHIGEQFRAAAEVLFPSKAPKHIAVMAPEQVNPSWFARSLTEHTPLGHIFPEGTSVRTIRTNHLLPNVSGHAAVPDLFFILEALMLKDKK